jgi:hypothetical protein
VQNHLLLVKRAQAFYDPPGAPGVALPEGQARFLPLAAVEVGTDSTFPVPQAPFTRVEVLQFVGEPIHLTSAKRTRSRRIGDGE